MADNTMWQMPWNDSMEEIWESLRHIQTPEVVMAMQSMQYVLRPPENIRERLSPLNNLCMTSFMDKVREGDLHNDIQSSEKAVSALTLNETGNEAKTRWRPEAWRTMGEELLALDRAIRVPRDHEETQKIFQAVKVIPESIKDKLSEIHPEVEMELFQMGSFPCDAKILDIDEFDFMLICDAGSDDMEKIKDDCQAIITALCPLNSLPELQKVLMYKTGVLHGGEPHVSGAYRHGPAMCVELSWRCHADHVHEMGVDVTIAKRSEGHTLRHMCRKLGTIPVFRDLYDVISPDERAVIVGNDLTTCIIDERVARHLATVSTNISTTYRLLKLLNKLLLPCTISAHNKRSKMELSPIVSSHNLKQAVLREVRAHPNPPDWSENRIHIRVSQILRNLKVGTQDTNFVTDIDKEVTTDDVTDINSDVTPDDAMKGDDVTSKNDVFKKLKREQMDVVSDFKSSSIGEHRKNLFALSDLLENQGDSSGSADVSMPHHSLEDRDYFPNQVDMLMLMKGRLHEYRLKDPFMIPTIGGEDGSFLSYKISHSSALYTSHPVVRWCRRHIRDLYTATPGADLLGIPQEHVTQVMSLYLGDVITHAQLENEDYLVTMTQFLSLSPGLGTEPGVLSAFLFGLNQDVLTRRFMGSSLNPSGLSTNSADIIQEVLPLLDLDQRAFILQWCLKVTSDHDDITGCCINRTLESCEDNLRRIIFSVNLIMATFSRRVGKSFTENPVLSGMAKANILVYYVIKYLMLHDTQYFDLIKTEHTDWAFAMMLMVEESKSDLENDVSLPDMMTSDISKLIRMEWDEDSLFRCAAAHGICDLVTCPRSRAGVNLSMMCETLERSSVQRIKSAVSHLLEEESHNVKSINTPEAWAKANPVQKNDKEKYGDFMRLAAISYLAKTPIFVYKRSEEGHKLLRKFTHSSFTNPPCAVLASQLEKEDHISFYFDLYSHTTMSYSEDLWEKDEEKCIFHKVTVSLNLEEETTTLNFKDFVSINCDS